jgi:hypothetical protein
MKIRRSYLITGAVAVQLLYTLALLALPAYLLALTRTPAIHNGSDAADEISGLRVAAAVVGAPALIALIAWVGLYRGKLWGWLLTLLTDFGLLAIFGYSVADDWADPDREVIALTLVSLVPVILLLLPAVSKFYWRGGKRSVTVEIEGPPLKVI